MNYCLIDLPNSLKSDSIRHSSHFLWAFLSYGWSSFVRIILTCHSASRIREECCWSYSTCPSAGWMNVATDYLSKTWWTSTKGGRGISWLNRQRFLWCIWLNEIWSHCGSVRMRYYECTGWCSKIFCSLPLRGCLGSREDRNLWKACRSRLCGPCADIMRFGRMRKAPGPKRRTRCSVFSEYTSYRKIQGSDR